jgi:hypothetical protein
LPVPEKPIIITPAEPVVVKMPKPEPIVTSPDLIIPERPLYSGGGGGGGGGIIYREYDTLDRQNLADGGMGRERIEYT